MVLDLSSEHGFAPPLRHRLVNETAPHNLIDDYDVIILPTIINLEPSKRPCGQIRLLRPEC